MRWQGFYPAGLFPEARGSGQVRRPLVVRGKTLPSPTGKPIGPDPYPWLCLQAAPWPANDAPWGIRRRNPRWNRSSEQAKDYGLSRSNPLLERPLCGDAADQVAFCETDRSHLAQIDGCHGQGHSACIQRVGDRKGRRVPDDE